MTTLAARVAAPAHHDIAGPAPGPGAATVLRIYLALLLVLPSGLVVGSLGTAGSPASLLAIGVFLWWVWYHLQRTEPLPPRRHPVRTAMFAFLTCVTVSYVVAMAAPMASNELTPADSGVLRVLGWTGVALVAADGLRSHAQLRRVLGLLVALAGLLALLGLVQFATGQVFVDKISIPGLEPRNASYLLAGRSGFARLSGTSVHPIEYGSVLTITLPVAASFAIAAPARRGLYRVCALLICVATLLSISRSALVCAAIGMGLVMASWSTAARLRAVGLGLAALVVVYLRVPGLLGALGKLFTGAGEDTSIQSRTDAYAVALEFVGRKPLLGRGFGTFLPEYWILDNQYLVTLIDTGAVGLLTLIAIFATATRCGLRGARGAPDEFDRIVIRGVVASVVAGAAALAFFDGFSFLQSSGCLFVMVGLCAAADRLADEPDRPAVTSSGGAGPLDRRDPTT